MSNLTGQISVLHVMLLVKAVAGQDVQLQPVTTVTIGGKRLVV